MHIETKIHTYPEHAICNKNTVLAMFVMLSEASFCQEALAASYVLTWQAL
jgi:hypothetical protein